MTDAAGREICSACVTFYSKFYACKDQTRKAAFLDDNVAMRRVYYHEGDWLPVPISSVPANPEAFNRMGNRVTVRDHRTKQMTENNCQGWLTPIRQCWCCTNINSPDYKAIKVVKADTKIIVIDLCSKCNNVYRSQMSLSESYITSARTESSNNSTPVTAAGIVSSSSFIESYSLTSVEGVSSTKSLLFIK